MFRLFLILSLCVVFWACSSDDSTALDEWFKGHGIASSYSLNYEDIPLSFKSSSRSDEFSAYLVSSSAMLGNANCIEQLLYFGLEISGEPAFAWKLRTDSVLYTDFYGGKVPNKHKNIKEAKFYWLKQSKTEHDTTWLKFQKKFEDSATIDVAWKAGGTRDTFSFSLLKVKEKLLELKANTDTLRLQAGIRLLDNDVVLRFAPPNTVDIPGLLRVAQKPSISKQCSKCERCLYSGVGDSISAVFNVDEKEKIAKKPVVFAELIMPKPNDASSSELGPGRPTPVYIYSSDGSLEDYRVDTAYVKDHGYHPNLVFREGDDLKLQVTQSLRNYVNAAKSQDILEFTLRLGTPMLKPESFYFYNLTTNKVLSDRFALDRYDFSSVFAKPVLRLWFADFGDDKK